MSALAEFPDVWLRNPHQDHKARCDESRELCTRTKAERRDESVCVISQVLGNVRIIESGVGPPVVGVLDDDGVLHTYSVRPGVDFRVGEGARVGVGAVLAADFKMARPSLR